MNKISDLIAAGKIKEALKKLMYASKTRDPDIYHQGILLSARLEKYEKEKRLGLLESDTELRNIEHAVLQLSEQLTEELPGGFWKRPRSVFALPFMGLLAIMLFFSVRYFILPKTTFNQKGKLEQLRFTDESMKVIGIYPSDIFGIDQKLGLHKAMEHSGFNFEIIDLDFLSFTEMKAGKIRPLLDTLHSLLQHQNIACIIGPSITECSTEILKLMFESESRVPIFVTSAASEQFLDWNFYSTYLNLFRTGTGIDTRARLINNFLKNEKIQTRSLFLVEHNPTTTSFGELYLQELTNRSEVINAALQDGKINTLRYASAKDSVSHLMNTLKSVMGNYDYCFMLGVGNQFKLVIDSFYRGENSIEHLPKFGGWMNGYTLNKELQKSRSDILNNKIFEITDIDISRSSGNNRNNEYKYLTQFKHDFDADVHPGMRDLAITYDAAICLIETYKSLINTEHRGTFARSLRFDPATSAILADRMKSMEFEAISSTIRFNDQGVNTASGLFGAVYDSNENKWIPIDLNILLKI